MAAAIECYIERSGRTEEGLLIPSPPGALWLVARSSPSEERLDVRSEEHQHEQYAEADQEAHVLQERGERRVLERLVRPPLPLPLLLRRARVRLRRMHAGIGLVDVGGRFASRVALTPQFGQQSAQRDVQEL